MDTLRCFATRAKVDGSKDPISYSQVLECHVRPQLGEIWFYFQA